MQDLYDMISRRKSVRKFDDSLTVTENEIEDIKGYIDGLTPLIDGIEVKCEIVERSKTNAKYGEYCLIIYSEESEHHLLNIGYMFEQLDLYLVTQNIGVCWFGLGKTDAVYHPHLKQIIMMIFGKCDGSEYRTNFANAKRKDADDIWTGDLQDIANVVKYAPSACNSQPWRVESSDNLIKVYRTPKYMSILPKKARFHYNSMDMGIFLCYLEIALAHNNIAFTRRIIAEGIESDLIPIAEYVI